MTRPTTLAMIGAGRHARHNIYPCFAKARGLQVVATCDLDLDRAREVGQRFGIARAYADWREMLDRERPEGVLICAGPKAHADLAVAVLDAGYPVYTEKPPAVDADQARRMLAASERNGRLCMTGFKKRYAPAYRKVKALIEDPRFGAPTLLNIVRSSGNYKGITDNPCDDYLLDSAIHVIDLSHFLFGPVERVAAMGRGLGTFTISFAFANGAVGTLALTDRLSHERRWESVTVVGDGAVCATVDNSVEMLAFHKGTPIAAHKPDFVAGASDGHVEMGFVGELEAFAEAIRSGLAPSASIASGVHTMDLIEAVRRAVRDQVVVDLRPVGVAV